MSPSDPPVAAPTPHQDLEVGSIWKTPDGRRVRVVVIEARRVGVRNVATARLSYLKHEAFRKAIPEPRKTNAERALKSIATMLGWENVPPRETLEREIAALKSRVAAPTPENFEGDLVTAHPNRCRLRDNLLYADIFNDDGSHRAVWRCHKRAGHDGPCSSHNDCGVMNGGVVCGKLPGHVGPHAWETRIVACAAPTPETPSQLPKPQPPKFAVDLAIEVSGWSPCRSKRGVVIFRRADIVTHGYNYKPRGFECDGSEACKATCGREAVHAEQQALLSAGPHVSGTEMLHLKTVDGVLVPSGGPSCVECSKLAIAAGIAAVWLYHADGWRRYEMHDFHAQSLLAGAVSHPQPDPRTTNDDEVARVDGRGVPEGFGTAGSDAGAQNDSAGTENNHAG